MLPIRRTAEIWKNRLSRHYSWLLCILVLALTAIIYLPMVQHQWLGWDDTWVVRDNQLLKDFSFATLHKVLFDLTHDTRYQLGIEYLPVRDLVAMVGLKLWGTNLAGFLLLNLALYLGGIALFYALILRYYRSAWIAFFATWFFALHPVHVEAVAWAAALKEMLLLLFFMASLYFFENHLTSKKPRFYLFSLLCFIAAILSKYLAIVLVPFLFMRTLWPAEPAESWFRRLRRAAIGTLPFAIIATMILVIAFPVGSQNELLLERVSKSPTAMLFSQVEIIARYLANIALPLWLAPIYDFSPVNSLTDLRGILVITFGLCLALSIPLLVWHLQRKGAPKAFSWAIVFWSLWFFVALLPVSQIVTLPLPMADRYLLLPLMAPAVLFAVAAQLLTEKLPRQLVVVACVFVCLGYSFLSSKQRGYWHDSATFWERAIVVEPEAPQALRSVAFLRGQEGRKTEQRLLLIRALAADNRYLQASLELGNFYRQETREVDRAKVLYKRVLAELPDSPESSEKRGVLYLLLGEYEKAIPHFEETLKHEPNSCATMINLANAYYQSGQRTRASEWQSLANLCGLDHNLF